MSDERRFRRIDAAGLDGIIEAERPPCDIRWGVILLAVLLCIAQAVLNRMCEHARTSVMLIATQISVIAFGFLAFLSLVVNPLLRRIRLIAPMSKAELLTVFAAMLVSGGISSYGLVDQLIPIIPAPYNPSWNLPQRGWDKSLIPHLNPQLFITDAAVIDAYRQGFQTSDGLWHRINWWAWAKPISLWMIFVALCYLMFYSLSSLLYDPWARREKLVFPLARMPEDLVPDDNAPPGSLPAIFRSPLFWVGFAGVLLLLSYNAVTAAQWIRGMEPLKMGLDQKFLISMLSNSIFKGIADAGRYPLMFVVVFTAIGVGFLLPLEISKSLWVYSVAALGMLMVAIWMLFGSSVRAFPSDFLAENNFVSSLGGGGLLAFAAILLGKLAAERWAAARARGGDRRQTTVAFLFELGWPGVGLLGSLVGAMAWLRWCGIGWVWSGLLMAIIVLVTVGIMRVVAEGGVYWFQIHTGPFHLAALAGGAKTIPGAVLGPLVVIYSVLFMDVKTFLAPSLLNGYKLQDDTRASRTRFHLTLVLSIAAAVIASCVAMLWFIHIHGANRGPSWFYSSGPNFILNSAQRLASETLTEANRANGLFYLIGAAWVGLSVLARRWFFWWLHPIGFCMIANALMTTLWFSFFLGWLAKSVTGKYGGRHMYARVRPMFVGMIFGELLAALGWSLVAQALDLQTVAIDINRVMP